MKRMVYYFAYAYNTDSEEMSEELGRKVKGKKAILKNYSLHFAKDITQTEAFGEDQ